MGRLKAVTDEYQPGTHLDKHEVARFYFPSVKSWWSHAKERGPRRPTLTPSRRVRRILDRFSVFIRGR